MTPQDKCAINRALCLADRSLAGLANHTRPTNPAISRDITAIREVLDHAACLQRTGQHVGCDCPRALARHELDIAIFALTQAQWGGAARPVFRNNAAPNEVGLKSRNCGIMA